MILLILVKLVFFCETGDSDESGDSSDSRIMVILIGNVTFG